MLLTIRKEQMEVFEEAALKKFEDDIVEHTKIFAPKHYESIGGNVVRQLVQMGIERAGEYGLTNRGPVRFFIELMFILGSDFDTDPQYPWAADILHDTDITDQMDRAARLYTKMMDYLAKVAGPENKFLSVALQRLRSWNYEAIAMPEEDNENEVSQSDMAMHLRRLYPEKCEYAGEPAIQELIRQAAIQIEEYLFLTAGAIALFSALMLFLGYKCFLDPQFSWIESTLVDDVESDDKEKACLLHSRMIEYLENEILI